MAVNVTIAAGYYNITLPNNLTYQAGDTALLTDAQFAAINPSLLGTVIVQGASVGVGLTQSQVDASIAAAITSKQDAATAATDTELSTGLALKQDASTAATDTELSTGLATKQDASTAATDSELSTGLALKQDASTAATDSELSTGLALKQDASTAATDSELAAGLADKMVVVTHGSTASTARPSGAAAVYWIGTVEPTNATNYDLWIGGA